MKRWLPLISTAAGLIVVTGTVVLNKDPRIVKLFFEGTTGGSNVGLVAALKGAIYFVAMTVGVLFGQVYSRLAALTTEVISFVNELKTTVTSKPFVMAMLASPIVFGVVYTATAKESNTLLALIFAFQNGFFCEAVINERRKVSEKPRSA